MSQFSSVTSPYGAPMGRFSLPIPADVPKRSIRLYRVRLDRGGYDDGGAYWGIGAPLYCAESILDDYRQFVRAGDRADAARMLRISSGALVRR